MINQNIDQFQPLVFQNFFNLSDISFQSENSTMDTKIQLACKQTRDYTLTLNQSLKSLKDHREMLNKKFQNFQNQDLEIFLRKIATQQKKTYQSDKKVRHIKIFIQDHNSCQNQKCILQIELMGNKITQFNEMKEQMLTQVSLKTYLRQKKQKELQEIVQKQYRQKDQFGFFKLFKMIDNQQKDALKQFEQKFILYIFLIDHSQMNSLQLTNLYLKILYMSQKYEEKANEFLFEVSHKYKQSKQQLKQAISQKIHLKENNLSEHDD